MKKHKILVDSKSYSKKPTDPDCITKRIIKQPSKEVTIEELAVIVTKYSHKLSYMTSTKRDSFVSTSLISLDIDNSINKTKLTKEQGYMSIEDFLAKCKAINIEPSIIYTTYNHADNHHRYRVIFQLNEVITDFNLVDTLYNALHTYFGTCCDSSVKAYSINYPGTNVVYLKKSTIVAQTPHGLLVNINNSINSNVVIPIDEAQTPHGFNILNDATNIRLKGPQLKNLLLLIPKGISCGPFSRDFSQIKFESYSEISEYFKSLDLAKILGSSSLNCIFEDHEDTKKSASIYKTKKGHYYYKCHACDNKPMNLYDLLALSHNIAGPNAYVFYKCTNLLIDTFNLQISSDKWKQEQDRIIKANKIILKNLVNNSKDDYFKKYPRATKELVKRRDILRVLTDEALIALELCPTKNKDKELVFNTSLRYIAKDVGKDHSLIGRWIKMLCYLGFIKKVDNKTIKNTKMAKQILAYSKQFGYGKTPQLYAIPEWTEDIFRQAEENYKIFKDSGATIKGATARQFEALGNNRVVVQKNKETEKIKAIRAELYAYITQDTYCLLKDLKNYAKTKKYSADLVSSFITEFTQKPNIEFYKYTTKKIKNKYKLPNTIHHMCSIFIITQKG